MSNAAKLKELSDLEGMTVQEMFEQAVYDSVAPGICLNAGCDYSTEVEPDCEDGYCENCNTQTVKSCLILGGLI